MDKRVIKWVEDKKAMKKYTYNYFLKAQLKTPACEVYWRFIFFRI